MKLLVTGGAGYIGSHVVKALGQQGHDITIVDNLSTGSKKAITFGELKVLDLNQVNELDQLFSQKKFEGVLHFAGSIVVPDSVSDPLGYYTNNTLNSLNLIKLCGKHKVKNFIFSSTAAVYGALPSGMATEESELKPINPYGSSKLMTEIMLKDFALANPDFRYVALRYFNVSGADHDGKIGQAFPGATHLIKVACEVAAGKREKIQVYGTDYPTPDGTCIRDFIHVDDLASAHVMALDYLAKEKQSQILNCGYGKGFSVKEVLEVVKKVSNKDIKVEMAPRRLGDSPQVISQAQKIRSVLGWKPKYDNLEFIIKSAYEFEKNGFRT